MKKIIIAQTKEYFDKAVGTIGGIDRSNIFLFENLDVKPTIKFMKEKNSTSAVIIDKNGTPKNLHKKDGTWKIYTIFNFDIDLCKEIKKYPIGFKDVLSFVNDEWNEEPNLIFNKDGLVFTGELLEKNFSKRIEYFLSDSWEEDEIEKFSLGRIFKFSFRDIKKTTGLDQLLESMENKEKIQGVDYKAISKQGDDYIITTSKSKIKLEKKIDGSVIIYMISNFNDHVDLHYYHNGTINNIVNYISLNKTSKRKIKKNEVVISVIGTIVFLALTVLTFTVILKPENTKVAFDIMFDLVTLKQPWIYLIWFNFFITVFYSFIIMYIVSFLYHGKKPNGKQMWTYFVAAQLRATVRFVTGEQIIGTIIWGWYITKNNKIRLSSLVGSVATLSIIRAVFLFVITTPFMISGTIYAGSIFSDIGVLYGNDSLNQGTVISYYILAWGGYVWSMIHNCLVAMIVFMYPMHYIYNVIYTQLSLRKNPNRTIEMMENREMSLISVKRSYKKILSQKEKIYRTMLLVTMPIFLNAFEMVYIFKMTENYMMHYNNTLSTIVESAPKYNNFISLTGLRLMSKSIHDFPIINIMPGNGIGIIEYFMSFSNQAVFLHEHGVADMMGDPDNINFMINLSSDFAEQTAFITRFFGTYLKKCISLTISLSVVIKLLKRRAMK